MQRKNALSKILSLSYKFWKLLFRYEKGEAIPGSIRVLIGMILLGGLVSWIILGVYYDPRFIVIPALLMLGAVR